MNPLRKITFKKIILGLILITISIFLIAFSPLGRSGAADTEILLSGQKIEQASPAVADFDGDGDLEIVVGGTDGMLYVLAYTRNSWSVVWSRQTITDINANMNAAGANCANRTSGDIRSAPSIADIDGDGKLEMVITTGGDPGKHKNGGVLVYDYNSAWSFSLKSGWPQPKLDVGGAGSGASNPDKCWDGIWSSAVLGNLDSDDDLEIVVEGLDRRIHAWDPDGSYLDGWPIDRTNDNMHRGGWSTPALADIDEDEQLEVIAGTDDFYDSGWPPFLLYVFNGDSSFVDGFPITVSGNMQSSPAIGDIDEDGHLDIVIGTSSDSSVDVKKVHAFNRYGQPLAGWPKSTGGSMPASPALGDLDNDGDLEVVIGCGAEGDAYNPAPCQKLYAFHGNGANVSGFPMTPANNTGFSWSANGLPYAPILADYDGDGSVEILVLNRWSFGLSTVESNGQSNNNPAFVTQSTLASSPVVADLDNDGLLEIVIGGMSGGGQGMVYIWNVAGTTDDALPWPMFHHDVARTGLTEYDPKLGGVNELVFMHQYGNTSTDVYTRSIKLKNVGGKTFNWRASHSIPQLVVTPSSGTVQRSQNVSVTLTISPSGSGLLPGWHNLGNITIDATYDGGAIEGSPLVIPVRVYIGDITRVYLPVISKN